ncbi:TetR/AcrR family transcriptional regulator [Pelagibacterium sp. 26DY04]|uniref:TetR/AcrR family transcriptional regulator n=1 Tax=Pelagibacterium sp. 26DY04 TaxID=2967130 RepID=UPI002815CC94|nr:TetR/AcrR family transcriptional regulator [Pelagibacterium sp. 26DY04]WMT88616.1 TetR/AcrR family transcriptional regulator [Pelagibacterium sp. 26DY04]
MTKSTTPERLRTACEELLRAASRPEEVTVRGIAERAGTNIGAINYHFGNVDHLIVTVAERVYRRLNAERLTLLHAAQQRAHPGPAAVEDLIEALIGPSIRWSLDRDSSYGVLRHMTTLAQSSGHPEVFKPMIEDIDHHRLFIPHFRKIAPWLSDVEIGFRISCLLGVRSQMTRSRERTDELTGHALDLADPEIVIAQVIAATAPMFTARPGKHSNAVPNSSRH